MVLFHPCWKTLLPGSVLILLFQALHSPLYAQLPVKDTTLRQTHHTIRSAVISMFPDSMPVPKKGLLFISIPRLSKDSIRSMTDQ
jgi:hypothetical protein